LSSTTDAAVVADLGMLLGFLPPVLVGLACAASIRSAATLTGNPPNMLAGRL